MSGGRIRAEHRLVLQDGSGAELLELDLRGQTVVAGTRVSLEGNAAIARSGSSFRLGVIGPVVDNDGAHVMVEKSGAVYLKAGLNPIRLGWFNGIDKYGLAVSYMRGRGCRVSRFRIRHCGSQMTRANPHTVCIIKVTKRKT